MNNMKQIFKGKKILITGHTGFKGAWLTQWLLKMDAKILGVSKGIPTKPSLYKELKLHKEIKSTYLDISKDDRLEKEVIKFQPDFIFHLAAQSLVKESYLNPIETFKTNTLGSVYLLNAIRKLKKNVYAVFITSDKSYDNVEWSWGYRETDRLGGPDPYSGSKGAAEIAISSFQRSFFPDEGNIKLSIGRAGNVIGGGDWSENRIVPDCMKSASINKVTQIRNPNSTRPWQHVLEPLSGYLLLAKNLYENKNIHGEAFNFGPSNDLNVSVKDLIKTMSKDWKKIKWKILRLDDGQKESSLLKLNCDKALHFLNWKPKMSFEESASATVEWYKNFYDSKLNIKEFTLSQIEEYENK